MNQEALTKNDRMRIELAVRNALNTPYKNFLSRYKRFALDQGRNIVVRVGTDF